MSLTVTDLFCGAGGSGLGAEAAGFQLVIAANHWQRAIETHATNFPDTEHDCADISQVDVRRYPATDVLWASPECTNHSVAKGRRRESGEPDLFGDVLPDEAAERSRATMWDVPRFTEGMLLRGRPYKAIVVENVVDAAQWIPFRAWLTAMDCLGYDHQLVSLNSMHAEAINAPRAPQSRDRLYVVFHRKGNRAPDVAPRPAAVCATCGPVLARQAWKNGRTVGRYRAQYVYVCPAGHVVEPHALPAAAAIDWALPGTRIGDRAKPLSVKTMARIEAGLRKYAGAIVSPSGGTWRESEPIGALTTVDRYGLAFIAELRGGSSDHRPVTDPLCTVVASGNHHMLVRHNSSKGDGGEMCTPATEPARTLTTHGHQSLVSLEPKVEDATFRMLEPHEIQAAMAFTTEYVVTGNRREKVRQLGNGVTPPAAEFLLAAVRDSLAGAV